MKKRLLYGITLAAVVILAFIIIGNSSQLYNGLLYNKPSEIALTDSYAIIKPEPKILYGFVVDSMTVIEGKIQRNQYLSQILQKYNVPYQKIHELSKSSKKKVFDVRKIAPHKKYTLICYPDSLQTAMAMIYEPNATEYVIFSFDDSVTVERIERKIAVVEKALAGAIEYSLAIALDDLGGSPQLTNDLVDVLAWQIDFYRLQKGDKFKVIYDEKQVDGEYVGVGTIKGVYFEHFGNDYYAYLFDQGNGIDYFDYDGKSLRKALLKYPLDFTRISSRYSGNRYHPVQKRWKAHRGTDFAAPRGTPIRAVGDAIVSEARYGQYNGNYVKLKHNTTYSTQYLHMSKIAKGIKVGVKVKQGQTIGYVGSTGLATGNHLCYRFWKNGAQVDALKVNIPPSKPIQDSNKVNFIKMRDFLKQQLDGIEFPEFPLKVEQPLDKENTANNG
ncbi:MAG: peptidoglycan DD-metalloendopeptidase family protein [Salinivirgaceae bacterium]|jgi:murein DD-endopeptidase MepM/ murein hydrolase activator NlpD|nr:peptidoglycan DD-metalloendopeptidase family protein [Salinivirgaceae bacterium]